MKLLGSTGNKRTKDQKGKNIPHVEITEAVLFHGNIFNYNYQQDSWVLYLFVPNKPFGNFFSNCTNKFYPFKNI